jgi:excinuclease ABC subunit A
MSKGMIKITGAKEHNLKSVNVQIPKEQLVVITGPSGSGKSSLALDTLYAKGNVAMLNHFHHMRVNF